MTIMDLLFMGLVATPSTLLEEVFYAMATHQPDACKAIQTESMAD